MAFAALALGLLPIIGLVLWIVKALLKVSFSVVRVVAVLFVVWFVYVLFSGSLWQAIDGVGGPSVESSGGYYTVNAAFCEGDLDLSGIEGRAAEVKVNGLASRLRLRLPANAVAHVKNSGALINTATAKEEELSIIGRGESQVYGSGTSIVQIEVVAAFCDIEIVFE